MILNQNNLYQKHVIIQNDETKLNEVLFESLKKKKKDSKDEQKSIKLLRLNQVDFDISDIHRHHPLWIGRFMTLGRVSYTDRQKLQKALLEISAVWYRTATWSENNSYKKYQFYKTSLRKKYGRRALQLFDCFFNTYQTGYKFLPSIGSPDGVSVPSTVSPKDKPCNIEGLRDTIKKWMQGAIWKPCAKPLSITLDNSRVSRVEVRSDVDMEKLKELLQQPRWMHLTGQVNWILSEQSIDIYWQFSGRTQQRETSVWPIKSIETWPSSIRLALFGSQVDIQCAMPQFVYHKIKEIDIANFGHVTSFTERGFDDIKQMVEDTENWRKSLAAEMKMEWNEDTRKIIKKLVMALSNGSNISGKMLTSFFNHSVAVEIVQDQIMDDSWDYDFTMKVGDRLHKIAVQFRQAVKRILMHYGYKPTRKNRKRIFYLYFCWEKRVREQLWQMFNKSGLMMHDGLDGICATSLSNLQSKHSDTVKYISDKLGVKITIKNPLDQNDD